MPENAVKNGLETIQEMTNDIQDFKNIHSADLQYIRAEVWSGIRIMYQCGMKGLWQTWGRDKQTRYQLWILSAFV